MGVASLIFHLCKLWMVCFLFRAEVGSGSVHLSVRGIPATTSVTEREISASR